MNDPGKSTRFREVLRQELLKISETEKYSNTSQNSKSVQPVLPVQEENPIDEPNHTQSTLENIELFDVGKRRCTYCKRVLGIDKFGKHKGRPNGIATHCKECCSKRAKKNYISHNLKKMTESIQARAKKQGWRCDVTESLLNELLRTQNGRCYYSGYELTFDIGSSNHVSVDRVDSDKGYERSNIVLCCRWANQYKGDRSYEVWIGDIEALVKNKLDISLDPRLKKKETEKYFGKPQNTLNSTFFQK